MSKWYPKNGRVIFHVDMNSFYASVEAAYDPSLKGKPLAIAGNPEERRGIVVTSSYEARAKGVKTTMPLWEAKRLCPNLIVRRPNFDRYRKASSAMFKMLSDITPYVQPVSIDEGYMDISACEKLGSPLEIAQKLQNRIASELDLPCSIGIATNKFLAKMASDMKKPMGITVLRLRDLPDKLWPLPIGEMYGVGVKTAEKLYKINIQTIQDLVEADAYVLKRLLGINGERLQNRAKGIDPSLVDPDAVYDFKSIGNSETLPEDTVNDQEIRQLLRKLSRKVSARLKRKRVVGQHLQLMIRFHDRKTITRSKKLSHYIEEEETVFNDALDLLDRHWNGAPIRLLGITVQDLQDKQEAAQQLDLFTYEKEASKEKLYQAMEKLTDKYGVNTFTKLDHAEDETQPSTSFQKDYLDDYRK
ncbi:DNA polymerase IV [Paraliobacillus sp. PM-2]|uniref:DNA polymerase IV n=1 Tax=Paraliobacillus sp. PM-2 TaxID=1462524 RepID=UPI00061C408F|nr:DNA polymerase IV [Paraliobacillus sp. PM-2]CQR46758.1 DNA polymerase IV [Paraliobacillus sp. PM-2]